VAWSNKVAMESGQGNMSKDLKATGKIWRWNIYATACFVGIQLKWVVVSLEGLGLTAFYLYHLAISNERIKIFLTPT